MSTSTIPLEKHLEETEKLKHHISILEQQIAWLKNQIFGKKSERIVESSNQLTLFELPPTPIPEKIQEVKTFKRSKPHFPVILQLGLQ